MDDILDFLVIGSGFTGQVISREFSKANLNFRLLDVSETRIKFIGGGNLFSQSQLNKTANCAGGVSVWGNALTYPIEYQYFSDPQNGLWNQVGKKLPLKAGLDEFGVELNDFELTPKDRQILDKNFHEIRSEFNIEVNSYCKRWRAESNTLKIKDFKQPITCAIKEIFTVDGIWHVVGESDLKKFTLISKNVVFASGAIANACLTFMATNKSEFFIGNHISAIIGKISLPSRKKLGTFANIPEKKFLTFSIEQDDSSVRCAVRFQLQYTDRIDKPNAHTYLKKFEVLLSILGFQKNLNVLMMAEHFDSNSRLIVSKSEDGELYCNIKTNFNPNENPEIHNLSNRMESYFEKIGINSEFVEKKELVWADAAHYFGTLPIKSNCQEPFVDENYRVCEIEGLYAVGASSFARGSHGHPTLLATITAIDFIEKCKLISIL